MLSDQERKEVIHYWQTANIDEFSFLTEEQKEKIARLKAIKP